MKNKNEIQLSTKRKGNIKRLEELKKRRENFSKDKDEYDSLNAIQKRILALYGCVVVDIMLTREYKEKILEQIKNCKTASKAVELRTKLLAIKEYEKEEIVKEFGKNDVIKDENGNIDSDLYDSLLEIDMNCSDENKKSKKTR